MTATAPRTPPPQAPARSWLLAAASLVMGATTLDAQISPRHFAAVEAPSSGRSPLALTTTARTLQIHEDVVRSARPIVAIAFRRDGARRETFAAHTLGLSLSMSEGTTTAAAPDPIFDNNHGGNRTVVVAQRQISYPPSAPVHSLPAPFTYEIPLDVPFAYTFRHTGPLVWDMVTQSPTSSSTRPAFDLINTLGDPNPPMATFEFGTGCLATGRLVPMGTAAGQAENWPAGIVRMTMGGTNGPASAPAAVMVGLSNVALGALPLPFVLPGSTTAPSGPCTIYNDALLTVPLATNSNGSAATILDLAISPALHGGMLFNQLIAMDLPANPMGLVTSSARVRQVVAPYAPVVVGRVESIGTTGPNGIASPNLGTITRFVR